MQAMQRSKHEPHKKGPTVVTASNQPLGAPPEFDIAVCGGTLGLFVACGLQLRGLRVAVVERRVAAGRNQVRVLL